MDVYILQQKLVLCNLRWSIDSAISLKFVNVLLADSCCKNLGRPAKELEMMIKILLIQRLYGLSNENVMKEIAVNLKKIAASLAADDTEPIVDEPGIIAPKSPEPGGMAAGNASVSAKKALYFVFFPETAFMFALAQKFVAVLQ